MGTKNNPGNYDCYENAHPDEPMFILLGRDVFGASLSQLWAEARISLGGDSEDKITEAKTNALSMKQWCSEVSHKAPLEILDYLPFSLLAEALRRRGATVTAAPNAGDGVGAHESGHQRTRA